MGDRRTYQVGLVGEANYQAAISRCSLGERADVLHEPDNPFDDLALVATVRGQTIGYVPRDNWLRDAIHEEGRGCDATIRTIGEGGKGLLGVVLDVRLNGSGVDERDFDRAPPA